MSVLTSDFTDCTVFIYDAYGHHLIDTVVKDHDRRTQQIQVAIMPEKLKVNSDCKLLILSSPTPCEYLGKVKKEGGNLFIAMYQGQEKESRGSARYAVRTPALVNALIFDGQMHPLLSPLKVVLINISTSGMRFRAPYYSFEVGDEFKMHLVISKKKKDITAHIINHVDKKGVHSDYGCRFVDVDSIS
jgi:hypothetical protein